MVWLTVARGYLREAAEKLAKKRKPTHVPIIDGKGNAGL